MEEKIKEMEGKIKFWKGVTFLFIVLFLVTSFTIGYFIHAGTQLYEQEESCVWDICSDEKYDGYYYDEWNEVCYCYEGDEITKEQRFI